MTPTTPSSKSVPTTHPQLPPGPSWPPVAQMAAWVFRPLTMLAKLTPYGGAVTLRFPGQPPLVMLNNSAAIADVFRAKPEDAYAGEANRVLKPIVGPQSLLLLDGEAHKRERRLMTPPLHGERMRTYGKRMLAITNTHLDAWKPGAKVVTHDTMQNITLDVIIETVFGMPADKAAPEVQHVRSVLLKLLEFAAHPAPLLMVDRNGHVRNEAVVRRLGRWLKPLDILRRKDDVDEAVFAEITARRRRLTADPTSAGDDILTLMLQARYEDGTALSDTALRDELLTLLVAGHETTATALSWAVWRLWQHPGARQRIAAEVARLGAGGPVPANRIGELEYLTAFIKETLRTTPIIPMVARHLHVPRTFGDYTLPAGCIVAPGIYLMHHNPDTWGDPERFRPERFLEQKHGPSEFLPFGGGNRTCIGMAFAYYEMKIVLSELVRRVRYRAAPGYRAKLVRRNITFAPSKGVPIVVERVSAS